MIAVWLTVACLAVVLVAFGFALCAGASAGDRLLEQDLLERNPEGLVDLYGSAHPISSFGDLPAEVSRALLDQAVLDASVGPVPHRVRPSRLPRARGGERVYRSSHPRGDL